jgi:gas vesicle protein
MLRSSIDSGDTPGSLQIRGGMMAKKRHGGAFLFGMVLGAAAGAAATLLLTPQSGTKLRERILRKGKQVQEQVASVSADVQERSRGVIAAGRQKAESVKETAVQRAQQATGKNFRAEADPPEPDPLASWPTATTDGGIGEQSLRFPSEDQGDGH